MVTLRRNTSGMIEATSDMHTAGELDAKACAEARRVLSGVVADAPRERLAELVREHYQSHAEIAEVVREGCFSTEDIRDLYVEEARLDLLAEVLGDVEVRAIVQAVESEWTTQ